MDLTKELKKLSLATGQQIEKEKKEAKEKKVADRGIYEKNEAEGILKNLPAKLRSHARSTSIRKCVIFTLQELSPNAKPEQLTGMGKLVFEGCKEMGLDVVVAPHEYDDGMTGVSCAGIWVQW